MGLKITGCDVKNVGTIVRAPDSFDIAIDSSSLHNIGTIADIYQNNAEILKKYGIEANTPNEVLESVVQDMRQSPNETEDQRLEIVKKSKLMEFISTSANLATIATFIFEVSKMVV
ncbi:TPA: hypothetical protein ACV5KB_000591 [Enterobacter ludwigii]